MSRAIIAKNWFTDEAQKKPQLTRMVNLFEQAKITKAEDLPELLSAKEAAPILKMHVNTVSLWMRTGIIRSVKMKGRRFTTPEWIADFMRTELKANG